jgi:uncharacterized integral membrane protein (TIGR00698 family)
MSQSIIAVPAPRHVLPHLHGLAPGLGLAAGIGLVATVARQWIGIGALSPLLLAILLGIVFHNFVGTPTRARPGVRFALRPVLRLGIILLGLQLTAAQIESVGGQGLLIIVATLLGTLMFTKWLGRRLGVDRKLAELIAAGTAICGASAVIATNTVTEGSDEDVAYAVAVVTVFGSLSIVLYPILAALLPLNPGQFGLWAGASIHEVAQVVAAAFQVGPAAGDMATVAKLSRVMLLAPVVIGLGLIAARRHPAGGRGTGRVQMPWFVLGFVALIGVNSLGLVGPEAKSITTTLTSFLLTVALAAMGLETDIGRLRAKGLRPLALGAAAWVFIATASLSLILLMP